MEKLIKEYIRDVPDFPKPGIVFKDITPILKNPDLFGKVVDEMAKGLKGKKIDVIAGVESRGFLFGTPLAERLKTAFVPIRKKGKLPYKTVEVSYALEYGNAVIQMHVDAIERGQRVVVVDDLLATGGTSAAACELIEKQGGKVVECAFVIELAFLEGRKKIKVPVSSLVKY